MENPASILCVSLMTSSCIQLLQLVSCMINPEVCVHFFYHVLFFYETTDFSKKKWFMNILLNEKMNLRKNKKKAGRVRIQLQSSLEKLAWMSCRNVTCLGFIYVIESTISITYHMVPLLLLLLPQPPLMHLMFRKVPFSIDVILFFEKFLKKLNN